MHIGKIHRNGCFKSLNISVIFLHTQRENQMRLNISRLVSFEHELAPRTQYDGKLVKYISVNSKEKKAMDCPKIPLTYSRRMSWVSKRSVEVALDLYLQNKDKVEYVVFSSRFGEIHNACQLVDSIKKNEELSPASFSQSVHNSSAGYFSLVASSKIPSTSISSSTTSFEDGLMAAYCYSKQNRHCRVIYVYCDPLLPEIFYCPASINNQMKVPKIAGMLFEAGELGQSDHILLQRVPEKVGGKKKPHTENTLAPISNFTRGVSNVLLNINQSQIVQSSAGHHWEVRRCLEKS